jgi:cation diffusion facilitator CzcD-associated flavoprotein CzcO
MSMHGTRPKHRPSVCIIGAGISGVTMMKALRDRGIPYTTFEKSDQIGGNWVFCNKNGMSSAYRSLHIDSSRYSIEFDDFPFPEGYPDFPHHTQIIAYFGAYAERFGVRDGIRFNTGVERARRGEDGRWQITLDTGEVHDFDLLVVANGHHWDARWPDPPFPGRFDGIQMHSHEYIDSFTPHDLHGKRVLVVGVGNSAMDISCELSHRGVAARLVVSTRRGAYVIPKYLYGRPLDALIQTRPWLPLWPQRLFGSLLIRLAVGRMEAYGLPRPKHRIWQAHPTVSSEFLIRLGSGDITVKPNIAELVGDSVRFDDGSVEAFDAIIYATGYKITFPFFDRDFLEAPDNQFPLFKRAFKPGIDNLIFVGFAQAVPSIIKFVEIQTRWLAAYIDGEYALPPAAEMERIMAKDQCKANAHYVTTRRHTMQVDTNLYHWDLRREWKRGARRAARQRSSPASERSDEPAATAKA